MASERDGRPDHDQIRGCYRQVAGEWRSGLHLVYRLSVVVRLPLLTPQQVARLSAEQQVAHERCLADRGLDMAIGPRPPETSRLLSRNLMLEWPVEGLAR